MAIEGKSYISNLSIVKQGTHGVRLTITRPDKEDVYIVVDKTELQNYLQEQLNQPKEEQ